jgi:hypothetical protein
LASIKVGKALSVCAHPAARLPNRLCEAVSASTGRPISSIVAKNPSPPAPGADGGPAAARATVQDGGALRRDRRQFPATGALERARPARAPPPPSRTDWTRLVPPPVLNGHALWQRGVGGAPNPRPRPSPPLITRAERWLSGFQEAPHADGPASFSSTRLIRRARGLRQVVWSLASLNVSAETEGLGALLTRATVRARPPCTKRRGTPWDEDSH